MTVVVVGGGISGCVAATLLLRRGVSVRVLDSGRRAPGGRLAGGRHPDSGAEFLRLSDAPSQPLLAIVRSLEQAGLLAPWTGRFGVLGSSGFVPAGQTSNADDFCGLVSGAAARAPIYVGTPSNRDICAGLCAAEGIEVQLGKNVRSATYDSSAGWSLALDDGDYHCRGGGAPQVEARCDALILATHDASLASSAVRSASTGGGAAAIDAAALATLADALAAQRAGRTAPLFTWSGYYAPGALSSSVPIDAAVVTGSPIVRFLCRDASKPGRPAVRDGLELWTAVSTIEFARATLASAPGPAVESGDSDRGGGAATAAADAISAELGKILGQFFTESTPTPVSVSAKRWGAGIPEATIGHAHE